MNREFQELINGLKKIRLTPAERSSIRNMIEAFMQSHPIRTEDTGQEPRSVLVFFFETLRRPLPLALGVLFLLVSGGGISLAAEGSLPGEMLYPIKVSVNEEIRARLAATPEAKAAWGLQRLERRLKEAELLARRGALGSEVRSGLEENFSRHAEEVSARIAEVAARGKAEAVVAVSSDLEASLRAHEQILEKLASETARPPATTASREGTTRAAREAAPQRELGTLLKKVRAEKGSAASVRSQAETKISLTDASESEPLARDRRRAAEAKIQEVRTFLDETRSRRRPEAAEQAEARTRLAEKILREGKTKLDQKDFRDAFRIFQRAHRTAQEAKLLIEAERELDIELEFGGPPNNNEEGEKEREDEPPPARGGEAARRSGRDIHATTIQTPFGELTLAEREDGTSELFGTLSRSTPCVDWHINAIATAGHPPSRIAFKIADQNKGAICVQTLGKPQEVRVSVKTSGQAFYTVEVEDEVVFSGGLSGSNNER